jgi:hypothetical protein
VQKERRKIDFIAFRRLLSALLLEHRLVFTFNLEAGGNDLLL